MRNNKEYILCKQIAQYMRLQYPEYIYHYDLAGLNLSKAQAGMMKAIQGKRGFPDFFLIHPNMKYNGLFLEIKAETPYLKDGQTLKSNKHLKEQQSMLNKLNLNGYFAKFVTGFDETKQAIDNYLSNG